MAPVHAGIKRRHFLRVLGAAAVAIAAAPLAQAKQGLVFHKDAFAAVWANESIKLEDVASVVRFDVIYGWATYTPSAAARLLG